MHVTIFAVRIDTMCRRRGFVVDPYSLVMFGSIEICSLLDIHTAITVFHRFFNVYRIHPGFLVIGFLGFINRSIAFFLEITSKCKYYQA